MKTKWVLKNKVTEEKRKEVAEKYNISLAFAHMLINMGIDDKYEMFRDNPPLHSPLLLKDMDKVLEILIEKIKNNKAIRIMGDMDVDGICATSILYKGLRRCGAVVSYDIPNRMLDGYGMNTRMVSDALKDGINTILTCDNGIAQNEAVSFAKSHGMTVLITDHHQVPFIENDGKKQYILPDADAVVDPMRKDCTYPFKCICGAMIAYKLVSALLEKMGITDNELEKTLTVLAGIASVCDVMDVLDENRTIIKTSLSYIQNMSVTNVGLKALIDVAELKTENISTYSYGFVLGPMLNASGRLDSAKLGVELFMTDDYEKALEIATELLELNKKRKELTNEGEKKALEQKKFIDSKVVVLYVPGIHESVAGIIAGRIREKFNKPTIILTDSEEGILKGSGRSIEKYNMFEEITAVKGYLTKFGGHEMAAGMSLKKENLEDFRNALNEKTALREEDFETKIAVDIEMPLNMLTEELIDEIKVLEPYGKGHPKPVIACRNIQFRRGRILGNSKNVLKLNLVAQNNTVVEGILFGTEDVKDFISFYEEKYSEEAFDNSMKGFDSDVRLLFTYKPEINEYKGRKSIQLVIDKYN